MRRPVFAFLIGSLVVLSTNGSKTVTAQEPVKAKEVVKPQEQAKAQPKVGPAITFKSVRERMSYAVGLNAGYLLKSHGIPLDLPLVLRGFSDAMTDIQPALSEQEFQDSMVAFDKEATAKRADAMKASGQKNKVEGAAFLEANAKKENVKSLPSGLQFKILKEGDGPMPKKGEVVKVHYRGTLIDGTVFDSSIGESPVKFELTEKGLIRGWVEALQQMKVGSKWQLYVPSELAYNDNGAGGIIGPNATLLFELELLGIEKDKGQPE